MMEDLWRFFKGLFPDGGVRVSVPSHVEAKITVETKVKRGGGKPRSGWWWLLVFAGILAACAWRWL